ncbi:MAG: hypothetical protein KAR18_00635 [Spirochaetes bacterium]|nr:hypothetical protein [Spirochaetota bacterium]
MRLAVETNTPQQFGEIFMQFQFSEKVFAWTREALRLSQAEKAEFHRKASAWLENYIPLFFPDKFNHLFPENNM